MDIIKQKKTSFCNNCGKYNHEFRDCKDPITSYGILLIHLDKELENMKNILYNLKNTTIDDCSMKLSSYKDLEKFNKYINSIKFLLIQRKHTLGYIEFIRGRYKTDNIDGIIYLFQQMTQKEINDIAKYSFDDLWSQFWGDTNKHNNEYETSKEKFLILKNDEYELGLSFYINNVTPLWKDAEWGFPKGRRNKYEESLTCAKREFIEESDFSENDFIVLENFEPLVEDFIGTNGIKYRHIYYLALNKKNTKDIRLNKNNKHQNCEIGNIQLYNYNECINIIRPYHVARKKMLTVIFLFLIDCIINNDTSFL